MTDRVAIDAPAKVNLRLVVLGREESGYHSLETIFCGLALADRVEIERGAPGIRLEVEGGIDTGPSQRNLVVRAAAAFFAELGEKPAITIQLEKRIPSSAGLGGGSSDAAATLRALNALHDQRCSDERLLELGADLGSDVPFFLTPTPYALAWGRGHRLLSLPPLPVRPVLVAHTGEAMPTAAAFERLAELRGGHHPSLPVSVGLEEVSGWGGVAQIAMNDLSGPAFEQIPRLAEGIASLSAHGAAVALLAGSGSAIFGIFAASAALDSAEEAVARIGLKTWRTTTLDAWPEPVWRD